MEDFAKARLEKDLAELKKLIDNHFAQVSYIFNGDTLKIIGYNLCLA